MSVITEKSEILFLYESTYSIPNGDPFTGEQRYDEETKKVLVSDVRIKRFIRDFLSFQSDSDGKKFEIYVKKKDGAVSDNDEDDSETSKKGSGSSERVDQLISLFKKEIDEVKKKLSKGEKMSEAMLVLQKCIDVRLFGGISTKKKDAVNLTGPVQFALLNSSVNEVDLRLHQNTTVFASSAEKGQGSIGTTTIVPYALLQIHGWINPKSAEKTGLTDADVKTMFGALWNSINDANTRTKSNQNSTLLLQIVYAEDKSKIYGADRLIKMDKGDKRGEQLRNSDDYTLNFDLLIEKAASDKVQEIRFYTENDVIKKQLTGKAKFVEILI
jgi:CRISPR-associated protein Csh2